MILDGHAANELFTGECDATEAVAELPVVEVVSPLESLVRDEAEAWAELKRAEAVCRARNEQWEDTCNALREYRERNGL